MADPMLAERHERSARILTRIFGVGTVAALMLTIGGRPGLLGILIEALFGLVNVPVTHSLVSVTLMLLTTSALLARKRVGLMAVAAYQIVGAQAWFVLPDLDQLNTAWDVILTAAVIASTPIGIVILVWLWRIRHAFPGRLRRGSWLAAGLTLVGGLAVSFAAAIAMLGALGTRSPAALREDLLAVLARAVGDPTLVPRHTLGGIPLWIPSVVSALLAITMLGSVAVFMRSAKPINSWTPQQEIALRGLLQRFGHIDSLSYLATRRDRSAVFSPDGQAAVTYQVVRGVCLAAGDPVGDPASWQAALGAWKAEARRQGWQPAVMGASEAGARAYVKAGFAVVKLGDEAVLETSRWAIDTTSMSPVRRAAQRAARAGVTVQIRRQAQIPAAELTTILRAADHWRRGRTDRGFSMALNRYGDAADGQMLFVTAADDTGLVGVLSFVPWGRAGASLDLMRHHKDAPNGVTELMVTELMAAAEDLGIREVSVNFAMFRGVYAAADELGAGTWTRLNNSVLGWLDRFWQLERLYRSNQRYEPTWRPRYLCTDDRLALARIVLAVGQAEGFLPRVSRQPKPDGLTAAQLEQVREIEETPVAPPPPPRRSDQSRHRLAHLEALVAAGHDPYPPGDAVQHAPLSGPWGAGEIHIAGRIRAMRDHGGVAFLTIAAGGDTAQAVCERDRLGAESLWQLTRLVDTGDLVRLTGLSGTSRTGTPSLIVTGWRVLAKSLQPVPFGAFEDPESRLRNRSLDLITHPDAGHLLACRSRVTAALRRTLDDAGYSEVETPILHTVHGGASARPFRTFSNAYRVDLSLRIAPELYLKRLVVGGMGAVYEIGRNFRNEGADATHNPEFTALEAYQPGADYMTMRLLTERLVKAAAIAVHGRPVVPTRTGDLLDIGGDWPVVPVLSAVGTAVGRDISLDTPFDDLLALAAEHGVHVRDGMGAGAVIEELYAELVEPATVAPTFYCDFPVETSPLARPHRSLPGLAERWDLVVTGMELGTAYTELTDPLDQRSRLTAQSLKAAAGDPEAMEVDEAFLAALEVGMPPTGGLGIGVDRLAMLLTGTPIRAVLSFPFVRPERSA